MTVEINNESGVAVDEAALVRLATFAMDQLRIHPLAKRSKRVAVVVLKIM